MSLSPVRVSHVFNRLPIAILAATLGSQVSAQSDDSDDLVLEEIVVTAQKREESLQEVPISVGTITSDTLDEAGIDDIEGVTAALPSIHFTQTGISTQVRVRGIGSDNSQGFEQSVGMYVDGIYYGRAQLFRVPLMDMERVELLRGPQGTLFGKNSIAGALNLTTAKPTEELEGRFRVSHEFEHNQDEFNGMLSGPLTDNILGRFAVRTYTEDGYVQNSTMDDANPPNRFSGRDEGQKDELTVRGQIQWNASDALSLLLKAEHSTFDTIGRAIEITQDESLATGANTFSEDLNNILGGVPAIATFESDRDYVRQVDTDEFSENKVSNVTLTATYDLANDHTITATSGYLEFDYNELCDCDFIPVEILELNLKEDYEQLSQEIRISSPQDQAVEWLAGVYYQDFEQNFFDQISISDENALPPILNLASPGAGDAISGTGIFRDFDQSSETYAIFARATWHASDDLHFTLGARYTEEEKDGEKVIDVLMLDGSDNPAKLAQAGAVFESPVFRAQNEKASGHNLADSRKEKEFTPLVNIEYNLNDDVMLYASYTRGFKAGGYDPRANNRAAFEFEEEEADAYELGVKSTILDGRGELNAAVFRTDYENLQISQYDGAVGFNVGNAKETLVQGVELDGRFLLSEGWTMNYGASYLDFEYEDFENGNCYAGQTPDGTVDGTPNTAFICSYTGLRGVYTPELTLNLSFNYERPVFDELTFKAYLAVQHVDEHNVHVNLDPDGEIDAYQMVTARIGVGNENWSVALLGKNLTDEYIRSYSGNVSLSDQAPLFLNDTEYSFIRRPRTIALEAEYRF